MKKVISIVISIIIIVFSACLIILPKHKFSSNENRYLTQFPSFNIENILNGKFSEKITSYISDHFPIREKFLSLKSNVYKHIGIYKQADVYYGNDGALYQEYKKPLNNEKIVNKVNEFNSLVDADISFMLVPTAVYINADKIDKNNLNYDQGITLNYFKDNLDVDFIDITPNLFENNDKYLYYKTDHHWTMYGANIAYLEYCKQNNLNPYEYEYETVNDSFYGTLYSKVIDNSLEYDKIMKIKDNSLYDLYLVNEDIHLKSLYSEKYLKEKDKYSYYLDGNHGLVQIENLDISDGTELLIIKDSYANSFIPFIAKHYKKIHVIDPRYYNLKISDYIRDNNIDKVLFLYNALTIEDDLGILGIK